MHFAYSAYSAYFANMLEHLFGSKTRVKLLKVFFHNPEKTFFVRELARQLDTQINAIRRELQLLIDAELILEAEDDVRSDTRSAGSTLRKYYRLDRGSLLYPELHSLLLKAQLMEEQQFLRALQEKGGDILLMLLGGRFVGEFDAKSDMLIVGNVKENTISRMIEEYEKESGKEIRFTLMTEKEFKDRREMMDKFLFSMFEGKNFKVVNKLDV